MKKLKQIILSVLSFLVIQTVSGQSLKWSKNQGSSANDVVWDLAVDSNNNTFAFGIYSSSMKLGNKTYNTKGGRDHFIVKYDCEGTVQWVQTIGSTGDEYAYQARMSMDKQGNIYVASGFTGSCTFNSANNSTKTVSSNGNYDIYIAKYDNGGNVQWVKSFGSSAEDVAYDIVNDDNNNVYITGQFSNNVSFGSTSLSSSGGFDVFVLKLDEKGNIKWVTQGSGAADDAGIGIAVDSKHNAIVSGIAGPNNTVSFNGISSQYCGHNTGFVAKLDTNGDCQWMESMYSTSQGGNWITVAVDNNNNIYLGGLVGGTSTATSEDGNNYSGGSIPGKDNLAIAKYDTLGNLIWFVSEGSGTSGTRTEAYGIKMSKDNSKLYVAAYTEGSISLGNYSNNFQGTADAIVAAIDTSGNFLWADYIAGKGANYGLAVAVDKSDNVYTCGQFSNSYTINNVTTTSVGGQDGYVIKYCNTSASIDSTITTAGSTSLCGNDSVKFSVHYDPTYTYQWKLNGSSISGANTNSFYATKSGSYSVLIAKAGCCSQALSQSIYVQNLSFANVLGADTVICDSKYNLSANMPTGSKFLWNTSDTSKTITVNNSGVYSIICAYNGCITYDTIQITLKNLIVNLGADTVVCGSNITLDAQNNGATYKWSDNSTSQTLSVTQTGKYSVDVTSGKCTVSDDIFVTIDAVSLNLGKDIKTCQNKSTPVVLDAGTASLYFWSTGDKTRKINVSNSGNYWCKITDVLGCSAIDTINIDYYPPASANFRDSLVSSHLVKFIPDSVNYSSYSWSFEGGTNSSMVSPTQYFSQSGSVYVSLKVITKDGCTDSVTKTIYTTSVGGSIVDNNINVYPNPSNGLFTIYFGQEPRSNVLIQVYNLEGRKVYEDKFPGNKTVQVNMQGVPASIYLLKISTGEYETNKIVHIE